MRRNVFFVWIHCYVSDYGNLFTHLTSIQKCKSLYCSPTILKDSICTTLLAVAWIYIYIYIRLKIKPNSVRIRFLSCQIFVLPSTGFEPTLQHHSLSLTSSALDHSTTSTPLKGSFNNRSFTFSRKENLGIDVRHVHKRV